MGKATAQHRHADRVRTYAARRASDKGRTYMPQSPGDGGKSVQTSASALKLLGLASHGSMKRHLHSCTPSLRR